MSNLVILPVGHKSITNQWKNKNFDLWTFNFDKSGVKDKYSDKQFSIQKHKYHAIKEILKTESIQQYEYIWLPDDDLKISAEDVDKAFKIAKQNNFILSQISVNPESNLTYHYYLRTNKKYKFRRTNFIEVMCPIFHKDFLMICYDTFDQNISSYGIELDWLFKTDPTKTAIIDEVSVYHVRPIRDGKLYQNLKDLGISEKDELKAIFKKYGIQGVHEFLWIEGGREFE